MAMQHQASTPFTPQEPHRPTVIPPNQSATFHPQYTQYPPPNYVAPPTGQPPTGAVLVASSDPNGNTITTGVYYNAGHHGPQQWAPIGEEPTIKNERPTPFYVSSNQTTRWSSCFPPPSILPFWCVSGDPNSGSESVETPATPLNSDMASQQMHAYMGRMSLDDSTANTNPAISSEMTSSYATNYETGDSTPTNYGTQDEQRFSIDLSTMNHLDLRRKLRAQLEYYFSRQNLENDSYLKSQMDKDQYVPIKMLATFKKVLGLTNDLNLIVSVLRESTQVEVDEAGEKVKPVLTPVVMKRCTLVIREVPDNTDMNDIESIFDDASCPKVASCELATNNNWYVNFETDDDAQKALYYLRKKGTFRNRPILARIKTTPIPRVSLQLPPQQAIPLPVIPQQTAFEQELQALQVTPSTPSESITSATVTAAIAQIKSSTPPQHAIGGAAMTFHHKPPQDPIGAAPTYQTIAAVQQIPSVQQSNVLIPPSQTTTAVLLAPPPSTMVAQTQPVYLYAAPPPAAPMTASQRLALAPSSATTAFLPAGWPGAQVAAGAATFPYVDISQIMALNALQGAMRPGFPLLLPTLTANPGALANIRGKTTNGGSQMLNSKLFPATTMPYPAMAAAHVRPSVTLTDNRFNVPAFTRPLNVNNHHVVAHQQQNWLNNAQNRTLPASLVNSFTQPYIASNSGRQEVVSNAGSNQSNFPYSRSTATNGQLDGKTYSGRSSSSNSDFWAASHKDFSHSPGRGRRPPKSLGSHQQPSHQQQQSQHIQQYGMGGQPSSTTTPRKQGTPHSGVMPGASSSSTAGGSGQYHSRHNKAYFHGHQTHTHHASSHQQQPVASTGSTIASGTRSSTEDWESAPKNTQNFELESAAFPPLSETNVQRSDGRVSYAEKAKGVAGSSSNSTVAGGVVPVAVMSSTSSNEWAAGGSGLVTSSTTGLTVAVGSTTTSGSGSTAVYSNPASYTNNQANYGSHTDKQQTSAEDASPQHASATTSRSSDRSSPRHHHQRQTSEQPVDRKQQTTPTKREVSRDPAAGGTTNRRSNYSGGHQPADGRSTSFKESFSNRGRPSAGGKLGSYGGGGGGGGGRRSNPDRSFYNRNLQYQQQQHQQVPSSSSSGHTSTVSRANSNEVAQTTNA